MAKAGNPNWKKGQSGNPNGRPPKPEIEELRKALALVEKKEGKKFIQHYVEKAFTDKDYARVLMNKLLPDLKAVEADFKTDGVNLIINCDTEPKWKKESTT